MDEFFTCAQTGLQRNHTKEKADETRKTKAIAEAAHGARQHAIARICARHELESDEFFTAEEKALRYL